MTDAQRDRVDALVRVCTHEHGVPLPAAALQFALHHPSVACCIVGMVAVDVPDAMWRQLKEEGLLHPDAPVPGD